jgi:hypothetical protein
LSTGQVLKAICELDLLAGIKPWSAVAERIIEAMESALLPVGQVIEAVQELVAHGGVQGHILQQVLKTSYEAELRPEQPS